CRVEESRGTSCVLGTFADRRHGVCPTSSRRQALLSLPGLAPRAEEARLESWPGPGAASLRVGARKGACPGRARRQSDPPPLPSRVGGRGGGRPGSAGSAGWEFAPAAGSRARALVPAGGVALARAGRAFLTPDALSDAVPSHAPAEMLRWDWSTRPLKRADHP